MSCRTLSPRTCLKSLIECLLTIGVIPIIEGFKIRCSGLFAHGYDLRHDVCGIVVHQRLLSRPVFTTSTFSCSGLLALLISHLFTIQFIGYQVEHTSTLPTQSDGSLRVEGDLAVHRCHLGTCQNAKFNLHKQVQQRMDIPLEIWLLVAQFIPDHIIWDLRTLNSAFFQAAMDARYRDITLFSSHLDDGSGLGKTLGHWDKLR